MNPESAQSIEFDMNRHQARREQGIPTLTFLTGPIGLGIHAWSRWCRRRNIDIARAGSADAEFVQIWVEGLARRRSRNEAALRWLAVRCECDPEGLSHRLAEMTVHDFESFARSVGLEADSRTTAGLCRSILLSGIRGEPTLEATHLRPRLDASNGEAYGLDVVISYSGLFAVSEWPALLLAPNDNYASEPWLDKAVRLGVAWSNRLPNIAIAILATNDSADRFLGDRETDQARTMLREGLVQIHGFDRCDLEVRLVAAGINPEPWQSSAEALSRTGADDQIAETFVTAVQEIERQATNANPDQESKARSASEQFLFERLESLPQTAGMFRLNERLEFRHGTAFAEADLSAAEIKLVIEIDGSYYHLKDRESYRRDRRKDWLFQRHGYMALRFLADDVVQNLEDILETILEAVALRLASATNRQDTHS